MSVLFSLCVLHGFYQPQHQYGTNLPMLEFFTRHTGVNEIRRRMAIRLIWLSHWLIRLYKSETVEYNNYLLKDACTFFLPLLHTHAHATRPCHKWLIAVKLQAKCHWSHGDTTRFIASCFWDQRCSFLVWTINTKQEPSRPIISLSNSTLSQQEGLFAPLICSYLQHVPVQTTVAYFWPHIKSCMYGLGLWRMTGREKLCWETACPNLD